jgi:replicative DNA helicase
MATATTNGARPEVPPHVVEAEQGVLGAALLDVGARRWLLEHLTEADFFRPAHRTVFAAIAAQVAAGRPVDEVSILTRLRETGALSDVGQGSYLHDLAVAGQFPALAAHEWGPAVADAAGRRRLLDAAEQIRGVAVEALDLETATGQAAAILQQAVERRADELGRRPAHLLAAVREARDAEAAQAVATWGLRELDDMTRGLLPGRLILVAARTSVGKSSLLIQTAAHNAERMPVLFCSYEMSEAEIAQHVLAGFQRCTLDQAKAFVDAEGMQAAVGALEAIDLTVFEHGPDIATLCAQVQALHAQRPLGLVVVDYLQKVPATVRSRATTREQEVAEVSAALKGLGRRLKVPVVAAAQLNRGAVDRLPELHDLRDSGAQEQDADQVLLLHREEKATRAEALLRKNRMGEKDAATLDWIAKSAVFADPLPTH